ncbi:hypothetical protein AB0C87_24845 [Actinomadura sp. NPDC048021]|uniref:hypothetical protein n=1 Tax=Actinomadura sp. NPDC048021 TaxID=3155385 RepID=UPI0033DD23ED
MSEITFQQIEAEVRRLADEKPEFVYKSYEGACFYNPAEREGKQYGACIFGQAFKNLDFEVKEDYEYKSIGTLLELLDVETTLGEFMWAGAVQRLQDGGTAWGEAVSLADSQR